MKAYIKPPVPAKPDVVLEMTHREAVVLRRVLGNVGGDPMVSVRAVTQRLNRALSNADVGYDTSIHLSGYIDCPYDPDWEKRS